jgi:hypothetical protein
MMVENTAELEVCVVLNELTWQRSEHCVRRNKDRTHNMLSTRRAQVQNGNSIGIGSR